MRQPRGIQRVLQTICPKQNKHYASQLPSWREPHERESTSLLSLHFFGGVSNTGPMGWLLLKCQRTHFSDGKNWKGKKRLGTNISSSDCDAKICVEIHAQLHLSCLEDCFCQSASPSAEGNRHPPPTTHAPHSPTFQPWPCMCVCVWEWTEPSPAFVTHLSVISLCALLVFDSFSCKTLEGYGGLKLYGSDKKGGGGLRGDNGVGNWEKRGNVAEFENSDTWHLSHFYVDLISPINILTLMNKFPFSFVFTSKSI